jgi:hypothetical protein
MTAGAVVERLVEGNAREPAIRRHEPFDIVSASERRGE